MTMSRDIPIIFSGPMVRALLDGRKTMTRRLAYDEDGKPTVWMQIAQRMREEREARESFRLWVKEAIRFNAEHSDFYYEADNKGVGNVVFLALRKREAERGNPYKNLRGRYVPRFTSRLTLIVTATKIERLQAITEADALAEGIDDLWLVQNHVPPPRKTSFKYLWNDLHGAGAWEANPEVVAISFSVLPKSEAA